MTTSDSREGGSGNDGREGSGEKQRWYFPQDSWPQSCLYFLLSKPTHIHLTVKGSWMGRQEYQCVTQTRVLVTLKVSHTRKHTLWFCDLRGAQPELCNATLTPPTGFIPPTPRLTHFTHLHSSPTRLRARQVSLLNLRQDQVPKEQRGRVVSEFISPRTLGSHP